MRQMSLELAATAAPYTQVVRQDVVFVLELKLFASRSSDSSTYDGSISPTDPTRTVLGLEPLAGPTTPSRSNCSIKREARG